MKKLKIITTITILVILLLQVMCTTCRAEQRTITTDDYKLTGGIYGYSKAETKAQGVVKVLRTVGIVVAVVGMLVLGIKYMLGSVEAKAEYKKSMQPYLIGFVMLFTITTIASIIYELATSLGN